MARMLGVRLLGMRLFGTRLLGIGICAALFLSGFAGCSVGKIHTASNLPLELQASVVGNAQTVDLSQFAGPPVDGSLIDYGDILEVSIAAGLSADDVTTFSARVGENGVTLLPEIGQVQLAGLPLMSAEQQITAM